MQLRSCLNISVEDGNVYFREFVEVDKKKRGVLPSSSWKELSLAFYEKSSIDQMYSGDSQSSALSNESRAPLLREEYSPEPSSGETRIQINADNSSDIPNALFHILRDVQVSTVAVERD